MKKLILTATLAGLAITNAPAAPVSSVESAAANPARQKVDAFLNEQTVVSHLDKLGVTPAQAQARVASLNDAQLTQMAAEVDKLAAGGDIQSGSPNPMGPIGCIFKAIGETFRHIFKVLFCWTDIR